MLAGEKMFDNIINWINENREWMFSGIGATVLIGIFGFIWKRFTKNSNKEKPIIIKQKNDGENATQIGIQNNYYGENKDDR